MLPHESLYPADESPLVPDVISKKLSFRTGSGTRAAKGTATLPRLRCGIAENTALLCRAAEETASLPHTFFATLLIILQYCAARREKQYSCCSVGGIPADMYYQRNSIRRPSVKRLAAIARHSVYRQCGCFRMLSRAKYFFTFFVAVFHKILYKSQKIMYNYQNQRKPKKHEGALYVS